MLRLFPLKHMETLSPAPWTRHQSNCTRHYLYSIMLTLMTLILAGYGVGLRSFGQTCHLSVTTPRKTIEVLEGESETLECQYTADESCQINHLEWCISKDGEQCYTILQIVGSIPHWFSGYEEYYGINENNLTIDDAKTEHQGEYRCSVHAAGAIKDEDSLNLFVSVPFAPFNILISVDETPVIEGNVVLVSCTADGLPSPTYNWTQNGVELSDDNKYQINEDGSELTIHKITKYEREYYNCTAKNSVGSSATGVFIDVYYEPETGWPKCEVHVEPNEMYVAEGDFAELSCSAIGGNPSPHLEWYNDSIALPECTSVTEDNGVVKETATCWTLTHYDNGKIYECKGNHEATEETRNCFTEVFDVKYFPTWQTCRHTARDQFEEDDDFTLTCQSNGNPLATLQWINGTDSAILHETNDYEGDDKTAINEYSWKLTRSDNQVVFECLAFNDIRENTLECRTMQLTVHFAPLSVSLTGYTDIARKGDRLQLSCVTDSSNPVSTISWYKNDQLITDDDHEEIQEEDVRNGSFHGKVTEGGLHFDVLASHNENEFSCKTTRFSYSGENFTVSVKTYVYFPPSEPAGCTTSLTGYSSAVVEGDDLVLTCTSCSGNPTPTIEWFKDENMLEAGLGDIHNSPGDYHGNTSVQNLTLHLTYQHNGQRLRCESFNEEFTMENDRVISNDIVLDVHYAPFVKNKEENRRYAVNLTDNAHLTCEINSNPKVEISWHDNSNETIINGTGKFLVQRTISDTITNCMLTIFNVSESDFGDYRCHGFNDIADVNFTVNLSGKRKPYPAYDVIVTNKTADSLTLTWTPGFDGGLFQQFLLEYRKSDTTKGTQRTPSTINTTDTIHGLVAMTEYQIRVVSFNNIGESHSDQQMIDSTLPETPKLENVRATSDGELTISVPPGACVKIEMSNGTHWIDYFISDPCDYEITIKLQGSGELHIYFCTDSTYEECGIPLRYPYNIVPTTSWAMAVPILISLIIATSIAVVVLAILVWRNASERKLGSDYGMRYAPHNECYETTNVDSGLLRRQTNQGATDFPSMVNTAMSPEADEDNINVDKDNNTRYVIFSNIGKGKQDPQTSKSTVDTYAVVDKRHAKSSVTDQTNSAQYAKVDIKNKKKKSGQTTDVYSKVDKIKDNKTTNTGQLNEDTEGGMSSDALDSIPPFMKGGEFAYANVPAVQGKTLPTATGSTVDNSAYEYVDLKKNTGGSKTGTKTKADNGGNGTYDGVHGKDHKSSNVASQNSDAGHSLKEKNVEGLVYADLDLKPISKPKRAPKKLPAETVDYAAIDFTNKN